MKTAEEILACRNEEFRVAHEEFVKGIFKEYSEVLERDLIKYSKSIIDLKNTPDNSDYKYDFSQMLHCIKAENLNVREIGHMLAAEFKKLGFKSYFDGSDAVVAEMP